MSVDPGHAPPSDRDAAYGATVRRLVSAMNADVEATTALETVAQLLVEAGRELVPSAECVITVVPPARQDVFVVVAGAGPLAGQLTGSEWPVEGTLNWQSMAEDRVVETTQARAVSSGLPPVFAAAGVDTARLVPLRTGTPLPDGRVGLGVLGFWRVGHQPYTQDDRDRMDDIGEIASLFIRRAELGLALSRLSQSESAKSREHADRMAGLEVVKTQILNLASHELRGPLAVAQGYVSMMEEGLLQGRQLKAALPTVSAKLRQMNMLVNDMLETARLEDSRLQLAITDVDLVAAAERVIETSRTLASPEHRLELQAPAEEIRVRADPTRLDTILANLVHNAIKFSPDGGAVRVIVSSDGTLGRVTVSDEGLGIAEDDLPRLFTRFGRLVTPENSHIPGTGLGLYLARQLANMHGGGIAVSSKPGVGSKFTVTIPLS